MSVDMKVEGFRELERALAELPRVVSKRVARAAMRKELKPVAAMANAFWPGADDRVFRVAARVSASQPQPKKGKSIVTLAVGAVGGAQGVPHAHLVEWGTGPRTQVTTGRYTGSVAPNPMLQPAWDAHKRRILNGLAASIRAEIQKAMAKARAAG